MPTISPEQSSPGEEITASKINNPVNTITDLVNGNLNNDNISSVSGAKLTAGTVPASAMATAAQPETRFDDSFFDHVASGCVWSGDAYGSTRAASMTAGVVYINGQRVVVSAITARSFTASKDTYVDVGADGIVDYSESNNNAASQALAADHIRLAIIVTDATDIQDVGSVNQGEQSKVLPIASSIPYAVTDSLGNLICPRDPSRRILGYRQVLTAPTTTSTTAAAVAGLTVPVITVVGRKYRVTYSTGLGLSNSGANGTFASICLASAADANRLQQSNTTGTTVVPATPVYTGTAASSSLTFVGCLAVGAGTGTLNGNAVAPAFVMVELV